MGDSGQGAGAGAGSGDPLQAPGGQLLWERARAGDAAAFCDLVEPLQARLVRQAALWAGDAHLAEDLAQETLVAAWRGRDRFDGRCRMFTWLCAILIHRCQDHRRKRVPQSLSTLSREDGDAAGRWLEAVASGAATPLDALGDAERRACVLECVERLPWPQREAVSLRYFAEASLEEIAAALGCPVGTVKSRLFHGLEALSSMTILRRLPGEGRDEP